jgi:tetratricopeptide (TPR) repeat protein
MIPDCTLTTCCFDLTKYNIYSRDLKTSIENMSSLLEVSCYLIIYTDNILYEHIKHKRSEFKLDHLTYYIVMDVEELDSFKYREMVIQNRVKYHPTKDQRNCTESHLVQSSKMELVMKSIKSNPFNTTKFGWIDSNVGKNFSKICTNYKNNMLLYILQNCKEDKFHIQILNVCDKNLIKEERLREYYNEYRWIVCGCLFITGKDLGLKILTDLNNVFIDHTLKGYGHAEEMYFLEILDKYYDVIERSYGDYQHILNNFIKISVGFSYILNIAKNYLNYGYHKECVDCCVKMINLYENYEIEMNYDYYFSFLFNYYVSTFYLNKDQAKLIVLKIKYLTKVNPYFNNVYLSNKEFYDAQFKFCLHP